MESSQMLGSNLRRFRDLRGLSQAALAQAAGISRVQLNELEQGRVAAPRSATLCALAQALHAPLGALFRPVAPLQKVRLRSGQQMKSRSALIAEVSRWLQDFGELEEMLEDRLPFTLNACLPTAPGHQGDPERGRWAALEARRQAGLDPAAPVPDPCGLLEALGVKVHTIQLHNPRFHSFSVAQENGGPAIIVNTWDRLPVERQVMAAVQELGHLLLQPGAYDINRFEEDEEEAVVAEAFASHFLMPMKGFEPLWRATCGAVFSQRVIQVKRHFRVDCATVLRRLDEHPELCSGDPARRFHEEIQGVKEPESLSPLDFQPHRLRSLVRRGVEEGEISLGRGAEILRIPLAGMRILAASWC